MRKRRHEELPADGANATERRRGARRREEANRQECDTRENMRYGNKY